MPVYRRARAGVSRSFQQLELFESNTVRENLMVASDGYSPVPYITDLVRPTNPPLGSTATAAVRELELEQYLDTRVSDLPYGQPAPRRDRARDRRLAVDPAPRRARSRAQRDRDDRARRPSCAGSRRSGASASS